MKQNQFKMLSLDGGGIKGAYTAAILDRMEDQVDRPLANYFDLITGTSTGAILAVGLAFGIPAKKLLNFYREQGHQIFPEANWVETWFTTKYDTDGLRNALVSVFGNKIFRDIERHVVIPAFNATNGKSILFRTKHLKPSDSYLDRKVVNILMAATAAPTFFEAEGLLEGLHLDGGIWANCPALVGAVVASSILGRQPEAMRMLSIGTTSSPFHVPEETTKGGKFQWLKPHINVFMNASKTGAIHLADELVGEFFRVDNVVDADRFSLDTVEKVNELVAMGLSDANENIDTIVKNFLDNTSRHSQIQFVKELPLL